MAGGGGGAVVIAWAVEPETYAETTVRRTLSTPAAGGRVHRRQVHSSSSPYSNEYDRRVFTLAWEYASATDRDTIEGYLTSTGGGALPMEFTPPQAVSAIRCRLVSFQAESAHPFGGVRMRAVLEEVI